MNTKPSKGEYLDLLLRSPHTIFSVQDAVLLWKEDSAKTVSLRLGKYVRSGKLIRVHHGMYAKDKNYNRVELAARIYTPSYISFETVLTRAGINFQHYTTIFVASYITRSIRADGQDIFYRRMKDYVLSNTVGIEQVNGVATATKERAFLDRIYVGADYHFDNLRALDWDKVFALMPIYHNNRIEKKVQEYHAYYQVSSNI